jgi:hypothetical protein
MGHLNGKTARSVFLHKQLDITGATAGLDKQFDVHYICMWEFAWSLVLEMIIYRTPTRVMIFRVPEGAGRTRLSPRQIRKPAGPPAFRIDRGSDPVVLSGYR